MNSAERLLIVIFFGQFGIHKFIDKKYGIGLLYLFTRGLFGIGWFFDIISEISSILKLKRMETANRIENYNIEFETNKVYEENENYESEEYEEEANDIKPMLQLDMSDYFETSSKYENEKIEENLDQYEEKNIEKPIFEKTIFEEPKQIFEEPIIAESNPLFEKEEKFEELDGKSLYYIQFPNDDGTVTEIEQISITHKGIFIVQNNQNAKGKISGNNMQREWTQTSTDALGTRDEEKFFNPVRQNQMYVRNIKRVVGIIYPIYSIITFPQTCELSNVPNNTNEMKIIKRNDLKKVINEIYERNTSRISSSEIDEIYEKLYKFTEELKNKGNNPIEMKY